MRKIEQTDAKQTNRILRNLLNQDEPKQDYPKILLVGAVTIEETTGGHILLYRLFKEYPADKLMVIGSRRSRNPKFPPARLPDVSYEIREEADFFYYRLRRQLSPRYRSIGRWYYELLFRAQLWLYEREIMPLIRAYQPDLILSFTMSFHW